MALEQAHMNEKRAWFSLTNKQTNKQIKQKHLQQTANVIDSNKIIHHQLHYIHDNTCTACSSCPAVSCKYEKVSGKQHR